MNVMKDLDVLYRDEHFIAVNKPSGLFVHKNAIEPKAPHALTYVRELNQGHVWPVHRLDRPTSGVLVFGCSKQATGLLSREFRDKRVKKTYHAVVRGYTDEAGTIDHPLKTENSANTRESVTHFVRLKTVELPWPVGPYQTARYSLVEVKPETGRRHQIRRHFDHLFHPLIGDRVYGDGRHNRFVREKFGVGRLLLSATKLEFIHPVTQESICLKAEIQEDMNSVIRSMFGEMFV